MAETDDVDLIVPPGTPRTIIRDIDERELIAFRGKPDEVKKVEAFLVEKLKEFIES